VTESLLRVAAVQYLNARPLFEPLRGDPRVALSLALPSEVARQVSEDEADVALMPVAAAATIGDLRIARGMAIGSRGPVRSVVIVSECPIDDVTELALDLSSRSSVALSRVLLASRKRTPRFVGSTPAEGLARVGGTKAALVIGDPALMVEGKYPHVFDLAAEWRAWTGLPFVFAAWCGRARSLTEAQEALLLAAKATGLANRHAYADAHAKATGLAVDSMRAYLDTAIRFDLGDEERAGLQRFFDEAAKIGLLPATRVRFFDEDRATPDCHPERSEGPPALRGSFGEAPQDDSKGRRAATVSLDTLLARAADGERLSASEGERIIAEGSLFDLGLAADAVRRRKHPHDVVTYIVDRNVNYTNVCTTSCRFCAFYRPPGHAEGYVLSREVFGKKLQEVVDAGGVQILLQGGLNPELRIEWYEDLFRWIKKEYRLGLHALSPEEILFLAKMEGLTTLEVLTRLHAAGLDSVPGGGAEILVDRVRRKIAKTKCTSLEWLGVMRVAHQMGLRSSATMMYGTTDTARDRVNHLIKIRDLQDETGGFTAFFCWDFQHEQGTRIAAGDTGTHLYLRQQALARILLDNVAHVGASWVTQGPEVGQVALRFGADDFGSVMFEENVVSSAGTTYCTNADGMESRIRAAGFRAVRRNVRYDWLNEPS
jgi:cyclic dehypoxanthinyl futalosine synthase